MGHQAFKSLTVLFKQGWLKGKLDQRGLHKQIQHWNTASVNHGQRTNTLIAQRLLTGDGCVWISPIPYICASVFIFASGEKIGRP